MSPSFWYVDKTNSTAYDLVKSLTKAPPPCMLYIDSGDGSGDNRHETEMMNRVLQENGWTAGKDFVYHLDKCKDPVLIWRSHILRVCGGRECTWGYSLYSVVIFRPQDPHENLLFRRCGIPGYQIKNELN